MANPEDVASAHFGPEVTPRDRALFEAGIKLGAIYHQVVGLPLRGDPAVLQSVEQAIEKSFGCQPYVQGVRVRIHPPPDGAGDASGKAPRQHAFDYGELRGDQLAVEVTVAYHGVTVVACLAYEPTLRFPLMSVKSVRDSST